jgi:hypothetical protein
VPAADVPRILERLAMAHANGANLLEVGPAIGTEESGAVATATEAERTAGVA